MVYVAERIHRHNRNFGTAPKNQFTLVYCRGDNRSKQAIRKLVNLDYTNIVEFGGILDWTGEIER